jgi:hypothetical protein
MAGSKFGSGSDLVVKLAEEFLDRYRRGERPSLKEYAGRYPEHAAEIHEVLSALAMVENIVLENAAPTVTGEAGAKAGPPGIEQLGDFRIVRMIGRGGMGVVYEAEQVSLGRHVALKVLPVQSLRDERTRRRFEREARAAAKLQHTNGQGQTLVVVPGPVEYVMCPTNPIVTHRRRIGRSFAIAATEVTVEQFLRHSPQFGWHTRFSPAGAAPMVSMTWYEAAAYCNWLSEAEGLPKTEWCYEPNPDGQYAAGMKLAPDCLHRTGYRLPTQAEWEYAGRAGSDTSRYYGESADLLVKYAWHMLNSGRRGASSPMIWASSTCWEVPGNGPRTVR